MKRKEIILSLILVAGSFSFSYSQDDAKEWKKKLKKLTPEEYKQMVEDNNSLQKQVSEVQSDADHYRSESAAKDAEISKLEAQLEELKTQAQSTMPVSNTASASVAPSGVVFKVQIGAFRNKDLQKYLDNHKNFSGDVDTDGTRKYTLGEFVDYWEADRFKKYLREMGVKDAWIVSYRNGERIPIKDALEGSL